MNRLEHLLKEPSAALVDYVAGGAGLSRREAELLVEAAGPDLVESCRWQAEVGTEAQEYAARAREVLGVMNARRIAPRAGLSSEQTWAALRLLVPALLDPEGPTRFAPN